MKRTAESSDDGLFRWWLQRRWGDGPIVCFVCLNPSTADAERDDPTVTRCIGYAKSWGFGALDIRNLYPYLATKPKDLFTAMKRMDVTGGDRGRSELRAAMTADLVIAAWGGHATLGAQDRFLELTDPKPIFHLAKTKDGKPVHPLFQRADLMPVPWMRATA